jgi:hypothetical protein
VKQFQQQPKLKKRTPLLDKGDGIEWTNGVGF